MTSSSTTVTGAASCPIRRSNFSRPSRSSATFTSRYATPSTKETPSSARDPTEKGLHADFYEAVPVSSARAAWAVSPLFLRPRSAVDGDGPRPARFSHPSIRARQGRAITAAYADDPASAAAEYGAQFRTDVETFVSREVVEACLIPGRHELPPRRDGLHRAFATRPVAAGVIPSREPSPTWRSARGAGSPSSPGSPEPDPGLLRRLGRAVGSPPDFPGKAEARKVLAELESGASC